MIAPVMDLKRYETLVREAERKKIHRQVKHALKRIIECAATMLLGVLIAWVSYKIGFSGICQDHITGKYDVTWMIFPAMLVICLEFKSIEELIKLFK